MDQLFQNQIFEIKNKHFKCCQRPQGAQPLVIYKVVSFFACREGSSKPLNRYGEASNRFWDGFRLFHFHKKKSVKFYAVFCSLVSLRLKSPKILGAKPQVVSYSSILLMFNVQASVSCPGDNDKNNGDIIPIVVGAVLGIDNFLLQAICLILSFYLKNSVDLF